MMKICSMFLVLFVAFSGQAREVLLGETELSKKLFDVDEDQIDLGSCRSGDNEPVREVQIRVFRNNIYLESVVATFGNGDTQEFNVRENFRRGSKSRWIDLKGNKRCIRSFRIVGKTKIDLGDLDIGDFFRKKARVELWGRRGLGRDDRVGRDGKGRRLASKRISEGRRRDLQRHRISLGRRGECGLRSIRIKSRRGRTHIRNLRVTFGNGDTQRVRNLRRVFRRGQFSRWIDLRGRKPRCIRSVRFDAASPNGARIVLFGRRQAGN